MGTDEKLVPGEFLMPGFNIEPGGKRESGYKNFQQINKCRLLTRVANDITHKI